MRGQVTEHGETLIEVVIGITIFAVVAVGALNIMNSGINQAQRSLEITTTRAEMDAQAEALRYLQNNFTAERELSSDNRQYADLWHRITDQYINPSQLSDKYNINNTNSCKEAMDAQTNGMFIINTRFLQPAIPGSDASQRTNYRENIIKEAIILKNESDPNHKHEFGPATVAPRIVYSAMPGDIVSGASSDASLKEDGIYRKAQKIEGIWDVAVCGDSSNLARRDGACQYYDFYIRSCWNSSGAKALSTLSTIVRLYNPEVIE